jgi:hypothetical protein
MGPPTDARKHPAGYTVLVRQTADNDEGGARRELEAVVRQLWMLRYARALRIGREEGRTP